MGVQVLTPVGDDPGERESRVGALYVFPLEADARRVPPDGACRVYRSDDAGGSWHALGKGLPQRNFWVTVLRDAFCVDDAESCGVYFGTRGGDVYASPDEGDTWSQLAAHLPDVLCLRAAVLP